MADLYTACEEDDDLEGLPEAVARVANHLRSMYDDPEEMSMMIARICVLLDRKCVQPMLN